MKLRELDSFSMDQAVRFHDELNPLLFNQEDKLKPEIRRQLLIIAQDFIESIGVSELEVEDVTISGSNAAYSYTPHSDIDLHVIVDLGKLDNDEVYAELFNAKKTVYNDKHDITIKDIPVECYVQDARQKHESLGEYSVLNDSWIRFPVKRRANLNQENTRLKYEKLGHLIEIALKSDDIEQVTELLATIRRYRKAGLTEGGEFGPENLAYKALRNSGLLDRLFAHRDNLRSQQLSLDEQEMPQLNEVLKKVNGRWALVSTKQPGKVLQYYRGDGRPSEEWVDSVEKRVEMFKHIDEGASGYIPSNAERNDPRFSTALTVDVKPNTMKKQAAKFGNKVSRAGIPPTAKPSGKVR